MSGLQKRRKQGEDEAPESSPAQDVVDEYDGDKPKTKKKKRKSVDSTTFDICWMITIYAIMICVAWFLYDEKKFDWKKIFLKNPNHIQYTDDTLFRYGEKQAWKMQ